MEKGTNELIELLLTASQMYYQGEEPILTDEDYDDKLEHLRRLANDDKTLYADERINKLLEGSVAGGSAPTSESSLVFHKTPMLSLGKANSMQEVKAWYDSTQAAGASGYVIQSKLDGFAVEARYVKGKGVELSTRGDGFVGEDMTYLFNHKEVSVVGLPAQLSSDVTCELRGELFARHSQFDKFNAARKKVTGEEFKNSRNAVVGVVKKAKMGLGYNAELTFVVYSYLVDGEYQDLNSLNSEDNRVITVNELTKKEWLESGESGSLTVKAGDFLGLTDLINRFGAQRPVFDIPTDGAVIKPVNEAYLYSKMGNTAHHPVAFIAFKYPGAKAEAKVLDIILSVGKTGKLTPIAMITPTDLNGTTISRITCHNFNWMYEKGIKVGATVIITRANDVIPAITSVVDGGDGEYLSIPTVCPECGAKLIGDGLTPPKTLKCVNRNCPSRLYYNIRTAVSKGGLDIDGLNNVGLTALVDSGKIKDITSLFDLDAGDLEGLVIGETSTGNERKFGKVRAKKIIQLINEAKVNTPAYKLLTILGFDGLGPSMAKLLLANLGSIEDILNASNSQLSNIPGFGETRIETINENRAAAKEIYSKLKEHGVVMDNGLVPAAASGAGNGRHFAISGKVPADFANRGAFVDYMEANGWIFDSSPKKTTNILFGDEHDTSSKITKAKKLGIAIMLPEFYKEA